MEAEQTSQRIALIEAILFVSKEPMEPARIMEFLGIMIIRKIVNIDV